MNNLISSLRNYLSSNQETELSLENKSKEERLERLDKYLNETSKLLELSSRYRCAMGDFFLKTGFRAG